VRFAAVRETKLHRMLYLVPAPGVGLAAVEQDAGWGLVPICTLYAEDGPDGAMAFVLKNTCTIFDQKHSNILKY